MKTWMTAAMFGIAFCSTQVANADDIVQGRIVEVMFVGGTFNTGEIYSDLNGGLLGRRTDGTYWAVYLSSEVSEAVTNRTVTVATAAVISGGNVIIYSVVPAPGSSPADDHWITQDSTQIALFPPRRMNPATD